MSLYVKKNDELDAIYHKILDEGSYRKKTSSSAALRLAGRLRQYCRDLYNKKISYSYSRMKYEVTFTFAEKK